MWLFGTSSKAEVPTLVDKVEPSIIKDVTFHNVKGINIVAVLQHMQDGLKNLESAVASEKAEHAAAVASKNAEIADLLTQVGKFQTELAASEASRVVTQEEFDALVSRINGLTNTLNA